MSNAETNAGVAFRTFNEIGIIAQLSGAAFERVLPEQLSLAGFSVLNHFVRLQRECESPSQLARNFQVTKGAMTNTVQRLEAAGYVKVAPDPTDGRGKLVRITRSGRAIVESSIAKLAPVLEGFLATLSAEDLRRILPTLTKLRQTLDAARD